MSSSPSSPSSSSSAPVAAAASALFASVDAASPANLFGSMNSLFARFAFVLLLVVVFFVLGNLAVAFLGWYTTPTASPYIVRGLLSGSSALVVTQDPAKTSSILVSRSTDQASGAEFSWSVWLNLNPPADADTPYHAIFIKGQGNFDGATGVSNSNGPGMYTRYTTDGACELMVAMDTASNAAPDHIVLPNMPREKWVHVLVRLQNTQVQVYVNASIAANHTLAAAPRQNWYDIHVCPNKGFTGHLSDLRYFDRALSIFQIRNLLWSGPSTAPSTAATSATLAGGNHSYLSNLWYA